MSLQVDPLSGVCVDSLAEKRQGPADLGDETRRHGVAAFEVHHEDALTIEPGIELLKVPQGPHEEAGADQQEQRQRHLRADQR